MNETSPRDAEITFEQAYQKLRKSVEELEAGQLPLETAIARYEEGMRLAQMCNQILDRAELRIQQALREPNGQTAERD